MEVEEYMTTKEAEEYTRLKGLAKRRCLGTSPPYMKVGGSKNGVVIYSKTAIDKWMAEHTVTPVIDDPGRPVPPHGSGP